MKVLLLVISISAAVFAGTPEARLTITERSGSAQADRPFSISYVFAEGDMPDFARPFVDGTPPNIWQCDVKTRWRDGWSSVNVTGASNTEPIYITAADHGFRTGEIVRIADVAGNTAANGFWKVYRWGKDKFALLGSSGNGDYTSGGTARGPGPGSLRHAIVSFRQSMAAGGDFELMFQNSRNPCSSGSQSACDAAGLDAAEMNNFNSGNWDAQISVTASSTTHDFENAQDMISAGDFTYWLRGPVVTQVIARDITTWAYDKGYTCASNCSGDYSSATWVNDTTYKSLTPGYILTFYGGWSGVRVGYMLENTKTTKMNDQRFELTFKSGSSLSTTEYGPATHTMYQKQRWYDVYWDGDEPGTVGIDRNREYVQYAKALPMYDLSKSTTTNDLSEFRTKMATYTFTFGSGYGAWLKTWNSGGGTSRGDTSLLPDWYLIHFMSGFDYQTEPYVLKQGYVMGNATFHWREATSSNYYWDADADGTANDDIDDNIAGNSAMGRPLSSHTNPTRGADNWFSNPTTASSSHGWVIDMAHQPQMYTYPYFLTGDPWFLEGLQFMASYDAIAPNAHKTNLLGRHGSWSIIPSVGWQVRGLGQALMTMAAAVYWTPDGDLEQEYFRDCTVATMAAYEGFTEAHGPLFLKMTNAPDSDPCPTSSGNNGDKSYNALNRASYDPAYVTPYCWGVNAIRWRGRNPLGFVGNQDDISCTDAGENHSGCRCFGAWYSAWVHLGQIQARNYDLPVDGWLGQSSQLFLHLGNDPDWNRGMMDSYRMPMFDSPASCSDMSYWTSWGDVHDAYDSGVAADTVPNSSTYSYMFKAGLSGMLDFVDGRSRGWGAYDWYSNETNFPNGMTYDTTAGVHDNGYEYNYKFALTPAMSPVGASAEPGDTFVIIRYRVPSLTSSCTVDGADDGLTGRYREYVITGLTPDTDYVRSVSCADSPYGDTSVSFRSLPVQSGTGSATLRFGGGGSNAEVLHGPTTALGDTESSPCSTGCSITIVANRGLHYYQVRRDGTASTAVSPIIIR